MMNVFELEQQMKVQNEHVQKASNLAAKTGMPLVYFMPGFIYSTTLFA